MNFKLKYDDGKKQKTIKEVIEDINKTLAKLDQIESELNNDT